MSKSATVVVLIVINGLLAMSELSIVSSRPARLKAMIDRNVRGAGRALELSANPGRFLSTVQIGITLVGVFSGAFSGATLGQRLGESLIDSGVPYRMAGAFGVGIVVAVITYGSLIVGELVPKQIALRNPEAIAVRAAPFMTVLAKVAAPLAWLLDISGRAVLYLLGQRERERGARHRRGDQDAGRRGRASRHHRIRRAPHDRRRHAARRPRRARGDDAAHRGRLDQPRSRPGDAAQDAAGDASIRGCRSAKARSTPWSACIQTREVLAAALAGKPLDARPYVRTAPIVHDQSDALDVLTTLQRIGGADGAGA